MCWLSKSRSVNFYNWASPPSLTSLECSVTQEDGVHDGVSGAGGVHIWEVKLTPDHGAAH